MDTASTRAKRRFRPWHIAALALCLTPVAAWAQAAPLTAYTVPVAPWTFPDAPTRGIAPEYLRYLFDKAQIEVRLDTLPYLRVVNGLRDGDNAAAILIPDAERDTFALRICNASVIRPGVLYKKSRFKIADVADLSGLAVGEQRGSHALDKLAAVPKVRHEKIESVDQGLRMLQVDRLDATFVSSPGVDVLMQSYGLSASDYAWLEVDENPVVLYVSRKSPLAADKAGLQRLKDVCEGSGRAVMTRLMRDYR